MSIKQTDKKKLYKPWKNFGVFSEHCNFRLHKFMQGENKEQMVIFYSLKIPQT